MPSAPPDTTTVAISGDVDATNRQALGRFVERHTRATKQFVLDKIFDDEFSISEYLTHKYHGTFIPEINTYWYELLDYYQKRDIKKTIKFFGNVERQGKDRVVTIKFHPNDSLLGVQGPEKFVEIS